MRAAAGSVCRAHTDTHCAEVFEKTSAPGTTSAGHSPRPSSIAGGEEAERESPATTSSAAPERSLLISVSEGAHSSSIFSMNLDARHALTPLARRPLTKHMGYDEALAKLSAHEVIEANRGQVEGAAVFFGAEDSERGVLAIKKERRTSGDTDRTSIGAGAR